MDARGLSDQETENLAGDVMDSLGEPNGAAENILNDASSVENKDSSEYLPPYAKERIGIMQKRHARDLRRMREQLDALQNRNILGDTRPSFDPMGNQAVEAANPNSDDERIQKAVSLALQHKDMVERKAKEQESQAYVAKQYQRLKGDLDKASDKYDDFDDVVMNNDVPITPTIRDAALLIDNPAEVLYSLGKNRTELKRISELHPYDQTKEVLKLSAALMGGDKKTPQQAKTLGQVKSSPVASTSITEKTSPAEIRARMRSGDWK